MTGFYMKDHTGLKWIKYVPKFSLKQRKKYLPIKTLILFRQAVKQSLPCNFTKKWILHLSPLRFCKKIQSSYFRPNFFLELHQLKLNWFWQGIVHTMDMVLTSKELFLKLAVPKK